MSEKVNVAVVEATVPVGPESMVGRGGATVSTLQARDVAADVLPTASLASTSNVCAPWPRLVNCFGVAQGANAAPSRRHSKVAPPSVSEKAKVASVEATVPVGPESIVGRGGATVSTVQARDATLEVLPTASFARTSNVCAPSPRLVNCFGVVQAPNASASMRHSKSRCLRCRRT